MNRSRLRRTSATGAAVAGVLLLASCGGGNDLPGYGSGVSTEGSAASEATPSPSASAVESSTEDSTGEPSADALLTVTDVRVGPQGDADRIELELDGTGTPGWHVGYVDEAIDPGKGDPVEVDGDAILQVEITGTAMPMDSGVTEYDGATVAGPEGGAVTEVVYGFVYEGTTTVYIGVGGEPRPFTVSTADGPTRLVLDVGR